MVFIIFSFVFVGFQKSEYSKDVLSMSSSLVVFFICLVISINTFSRIEHFYCLHLYTKICPLGSEIATEYRDS